MNCILSCYTPESWLIKERLEGVDFKVEPCDMGSRCYYDTKKIVLDPSLFEGKVGEIYPKALEALHFEISNWEAREQVFNLLGRISDLKSYPFALAFELIEHQSALKTKQAICSAFSQPMWKHFAFALIPENFHVHLLRQIYFGHTQRIMDRYYPHLEQEPLPFQPLLEEEKELVCVALDLLGDPTPKAKEQYQKIKAMCKGPSLSRLLEIEEFTGAN